MGNGACAPPGKAPSSFHWAGSQCLLAQPASTNILNSRRPDLQHQLNPRQLSHLQGRRLGLELFSQGDSWQASGIHVNRALQHLRWCQAVEPRGRPASQKLEHGRHQHSPSKCSLEVQEHGSPTIPLSCAHWSFAKHPIAGEAPRRRTARRSSKTEEDTLAPLMRTCASTLSSSWPPQQAVDSSSRQ